MSTVPAGATKCRKCIRDFKKEGRQGDLGPTSECTQLCPTRWEFWGAGRSIREWHPDSLGRTVEEAIKMFKKSIVAPSVAIIFTPLTGCLPAGVSHGGCGMTAGRRQSRGKERVRESVFSTLSSCFGIKFVHRSLMMSSPLTVPCRNGDACPWRKQGRCLFRHEDSMAGVTRDGVSESIGALAVWIAELVCQRWEHNPSGRRRGSMPPMMVSPRA